MVNLKMNEKKKMKWRKTTNEVQHTGNCVFDEEEAQLISHVNESTVNRMAPVPLQSARTVSVFRNADAHARNVAILLHSESS
jgi:hypothetical protein